MTIVMMIIVVLTLLAGFAVNYGYNKRRILDVSSGRRDIINYRAEAGLVDALTRIRLNATAGLSPAGSFLTPTYDPAPYQLDVDGGGTVNATTKICSADCDVEVDIGPVTNALTGARSINSTGLDT
jgi:hypothetical protein